MYRFDAHRPSFSRGENSFSGLQPLDQLERGVDLPERIFAAHRTLKRPRVSEVFQDGLALKVVAAKCFDGVPKRLFRNGARELRVMNQVLTCGAGGGGS